MSSKKTVKKSNPMAAQAKARIELIKKQKEEEEAELKRLEDLETERLLKIEEEEKALLAIQEEKAKKKREKIEKQKSEGTYLTPAQKRKQKELEQKRASILNQLNQKSKIEESKIESEEEREDSKEESVEIEDPEFDNNFRNPIFTIMGHVDTGKTSILDYIRNSNIQKGEVGGITQQIGASEIGINRFTTNKYPFKSFLVIDTPGHEHFVNLRERGTALCDLAIVVIDINHGLEPQTKEVLNRCFNNNIPFIIAMNKVDVINNWNTIDLPIINKVNHRDIKQYYDDKINILIREFSRKARKNLVPFNEYSNQEDTICFVPVSAKTGEGMTELIETLSTFCVDNFLDELQKTNVLDATIMESKKSDSGEFSLDVIVKTGTVRVRDYIGLSTTEGPVVTRIRSLLLPEENEEMRRTNKYRSVQFVEGSSGVKILAKGIEGTIPGIPLFVLEDPDDDFEIFESNMELDDEGIMVSAPTLGQLEDFVNFIKANGIPVSIAVIGNISKKDIIKVSKFVEKGKQQFMHVLCFDTDANTEAKEFASKNGINFHIGHTIYNVHDLFINNTKTETENRNLEIEAQAIFPYKLSILSDGIIRKSNPVILGVKVEVGKLHKHSNICDETGQIIGKIIGIRNKDQNVEFADINEEVSISIETSLTFGRHFNEKSKFYPKISRASLDCLKENFKEKIKKDIFDIIKIMKVTQNIV